MLRAALAALALFALLAALAGAVRVVPWLLDPALPLPVVSVFARSVAAYLGEIALWAALPVGLALELAARSERGELAVFALLGESPTRTVGRLAPLLLVWCLALGGASFASGTTASAPGRVLAHLLEEGEAECARTDVRSSQAVPFLGASWICDPQIAPRLVGRAPMGGVSYLAQHAETNGDVSMVRLQDARFYREGIDLHAGTVEIRGLRPFVSPAALAPVARAATVVICALASAVLVALSLCRRGAAPEPIAPALALAAGLIGPVAALLALSAAARKPTLAIVLALFASSVLPVLVLELRVASLRRRLQPGRSSYRSL